MMGNYFGNNLIGWSFMPFGWIFMVSFWGFIIWVIFSLTRGSHKNGHMCGHGHSDDEYGKDTSSLQTLKDRYAKGEITKKEFEEMKKVIS